MSQQTHYRSYRGRVFTGRMTQPIKVKTQILSYGWYHIKLNMNKTSRLHQSKLNSETIQYVDTDIVL